MDTHGIQLRYIRGEIWINKKRSIDTQEKKYGFTM